MRTANSAAARSSERPRQPSHSAMMRPQADRRVDRDGGDEQRVEGQPRHAAARARENLGRREPAADGEDDRREVHDDAEREHHGGGALRQPQPRLASGFATASAPQRPARSQLAPQRRAGGRALQAGDRGGRGERLRTIGAAALMAVAGVAAGVAGDGEEALGLASIAHVVDERPGPVQRRRPEVIRVPGDDVAGRVADAAADALDGGVGLPALRARPARRRRSPRRRPRTA